MLLGSCADDPEARRQTSRAVQQIRSADTVVFRDEEGGYRVEVPAVLTADRAMRRFTLEGLGPVLSGLECARGLAVVSLPGPHEKWSPAALDEIQTVFTSAGFERVVFHLEGEDDIPILRE